MWVVSLCTLYHTIIITNMTLCHLLCVICTQITSYSLNHFKRHTFWFFTVWKEYFVQRIAMRDVLNHESLTMKVFRRPNHLIYFDSDLELSITVPDIFVRYGRYFEIAQKVMEGDLSHDGICCILYACDFGMWILTRDRYFELKQFWAIPKSHAYNMHHIPSCDKSPSITFWAISKHLP